jgi:hypothetical protein
MWKQKLNFYKLCTFCDIIYFSFLFAGMCILFHIRGDCLHRHLRAQHHAGAGRNGRTGNFILKDSSTRLLFHAQHYAGAGRHGRTENFYLKGIIAHVFFMLCPTPRSWQAWKNWKFYFKRDSSIRLFTFMLSNMPELAGMEELDIFLLKTDSSTRLLTFLLSTMPELAGIVMSTIPKRKQKRSDIEANYRNETKMF